MYAAWARTATPAVGRVQGRRAELAELELTAAQHPSSSVRSSCQAGHAVQFQLFSAPNTYWRALQAPLQQLAQLMPSMAHTQSPAASIAALTRQQRPLQQLMRLVPHDLPVLAGPRLPLIPIHNQVVRAVIVLQGAGRAYARQLREGHGRGECLAAAARGTTPPQAAPACKKCQL